MKAAVALAPALASLLSLGATVGAGERGATAASGSPVVIPLRLRDNFPIIVAKIDGVETPLVLDTGDESTVALQQTVLDRIKAEPTGESTKQQFAEGPIVNSKKFRIPRLELEQAPFTDIVGRVDIHDPAYQATDVGQKGFLGTGLLKPYRVVFNYKVGRMTLIPSHVAGDSSNQCRGTAVPFAASRQAQVVRCWQLTIVEAGRDAPLEARRERASLFGARGALDAPACGRSASPLGRNQP